MRSGRSDLKTLHRSVFAPAAPGPVLTPHICTPPELREPHKVPGRAGGQPVAILRNAALVGCPVPAEAVEHPAHRPATMEAVVESLTRRRAINQPVLDHLRDKSARAG